MASRFRHMPLVDSYPRYPRYPQARDAILRSRDSARHESFRMWPGTATEAETPKAPTTGHRGADQPPERPQGRTERSKRRRRRPEATRVPEAQADGARRTRARRERDALTPRGQGVEPRRDERASRPLPQGTERPTTGTPDEVGAGSNAGPHFPFGGCRRGGCAVAPRPARSSPSSRRKSGSPSALHRVPFREILTVVRMTWRERARPPSDRPARHSASRPPAGRQPALPHDRCAGATAALNAQLPRLPVRAIASSKARLDAVRGASLARGVDGGSADPSRARRPASRAAYSASGSPGGSEVGEAVVAEAFGLDSRIEIGLVHRFSGRV